MRPNVNSESKIPSTDAEGSSQSSFFAKLWRGTGRILTSPARLLPKREIAEGANLIGGLAEAIKKGPRRRQAMVVEDDRSFDLSGTAYFHGISVDELEAVLGRRRHLTMRFAYLAFILGWCFFFAWCYRLVNLPGNIGFLVLVIEYAPFCVVFFLLSFRSALLNYQIRIRRLATAGEYLRTSERFWPN
jgi:hypothetical protein